MKKTWGFPEEKQPCGTNKFRFLTPREGQSITGLPGITVQRVQTHPWFIVIWELLTNKVPGPHLTMPYCCYSRTVIFYLRGYVERRFSHLYNINGKWGYTKRGFHYEQWQQLDHT